MVGEQRAEALRLNDGTRVPLDILVMCIGSTPRTELAKQAGLDVASGVVVDDHMRTSDERIFAVGDVAEHRGQVAGLWTVATEQAEIAAQNVTGAEVAWSASTEFPARLKDVGLDVLSIGRVTPAAGDEVIVDESPAARTYRKLVLDDGQLVGQARSKYEIRRIGTAKCPVVRPKSQQGQSTRSGLSRWSRS